MKKILVLLFLAAIGFYLNHSHFPDLARVFLSHTSRAPGTAVVAFLLFVCGHLLRISNNRILFKIILPREMKNRQLRFTITNAFFAGYFFNTILPFKLGEIIRGDFLGKKLKIGRGTALFVIAVERIFDCLILSSLGIGLLVSPMIFNYGNLPDQYFASLQNLIKLPLSLLIFGVILTICLLTLFYEIKPLLVLGHKFTSQFNEHLKNQLRFRIWSTIHGMHLIFRSTVFSRYILIAAAMWSCYIAGTITLFRSINDNFHLNLIVSALTQIISSLTINVAFTNNFRESLQNLLAFDGNPLPNSNQIISVSYLIISLQLCALIAIYLVQLLVNKNSPRYAEINESDPRLNKVQRQINLASGFSDFLDQYFSGTDLFKKVNLFELSGDIKLLKTFNGGSNAITFLAATGQGQTKFVRKVCNQAHAEKLKAQHDWLAAVQVFPQFPRILSQGTAKNLYFYDLSFDSTAVPFLNFIHQNPVEKSRKYLDEIIDFLNKEIYLPATPCRSRDNVVAYIEEKVIKKVGEVTAADKGLEKMNGQEFVLVNGQSYRGLSASVNKILNDKSIMDDLADYRESQIHGDLTIENIVITGNGFLILDPNNENHISSRMVDFAKLNQSLNSGYEFLVQLRSVEMKDNAIQFSDERSFRYRELHKFLDAKAKQTLSGSEYRSLLFHEAVHYTRLLPYRAKLTPHILPAFYAVAVKLFDEFIGQY